ncbi:MAG: type II secretion system F family protein [Capsulimonadaceae bacterium]
MNHLSPVIIGGVAVSVSAIVYGIADYFSKRKDQQGVNVQSRLDGQGLKSSLQPLSGAAAQGGQPTLMSQRPDVLPTVSGYLASNDFGKQLRTHLHQADMRLRPAEFILMCLVCIVGMGFVGLTCTHQISMVLIMAVIGLIIPVCIIKYRQADRTKRFNKQLPDALTLISSSLRTGYSFLHSCDMVVTEMGPPIAQEFAWVHGEVRLGVPMEHALQRMVQRIRSYDFDLVVTAVSIQLQVGGNLAEILDTIAGTIRERIQIKGEIDGLTAEGKLSGIIVFLLPIFLSLYLRLTNKDYFTPMLQDPMGVPMIIITIILMVTGGLIIKKMVDIDV